MPLHKTPARSIRRRRTELRKSADAETAVYVEAFTNRTFHSTRLAGFAPGDAGYAPGDVLELCYAMERPDLPAGLPYEDAAQIIFQDLNDDGYPHPHKSFPSLSIGDVVSYRDGSVAGSLSVELTGFAPVDPPVFASAAEHSAYDGRRKLGY